ncbi:MAG: MaoC family dehydratase N-terminal domain-containing protein [Actinobacteria bacterium]|nr:MaoC family dehydratase N-terminal domain-containing protein [Actinomycetota bacterium]
MAEPLRFGLDRLGEWTESREFEITPERLASYARASNEAAPALLDGEVAGPVFAIVPIWDVLHEATGPVVPEAAAPHVLHVGQEIRYRAPLGPMGPVKARAAVVGVHPKSSGTIVLIKGEIADPGGEVLAELFVTEFYRGVTADGGGGDRLPDSGPAAADGDPDATVSEQVDLDQAERYAEASGDHNAIHLDQQAAQAVGLPGTIVHGLCLLAVASRAALRVGGAEGTGRTKRLGVRFSKPVRPGESLLTRVWRIDEGRLAFETIDNAGEVVLRDGFVELS